MYRRRIANWRPPVLLIHRDDDRNVPFQQITDLVEKLRAQNVAFEELIIPTKFTTCFAGAIGSAPTAPPPNSSTANWLSRANGNNPAKRGQGTF
jgi:prolyl oligopeptidase family protein